MFRACSSGKSGGVGNGLAGIVRGSSGPILWQVAVAAVQEIINAGINRPTTVATLSRRTGGYVTPPPAALIFSPPFFSLLFYSDENMTGIDSSVQIEISVIFRLSQLAYYHIVCAERLHTVAMCQNDASCPCDLGSQVNDWANLRHRE